MPTSHRNSIANEPYTEKWRELALANPLLWRAMRSVFGPAISFPQHAQKIDMWLTMSRCGRTSVEIQEFRGLRVNDSALNWESDVLNALAPHHAAWERLQLHLFRFARNRCLLPFTRPMPLLRHLDLTFQDKQNFDSFDPIVLAEAPLLCSVILDRCAATRIILPWAQLTRLNLRSIYPGVGTATNTTTTSGAKAVLLIRRPATAAAMYPSKGISRTPSSGPR
ncbi:hypothetical protein B0H16DRAFT_1806949 [Mycena metata]|uniref:Uncharacterized protein n=1 Tax=Mycena metata TaxID=1033252 RepID=A0AAD7JDA8_9AGAR|nr:hypothetical protein B0H16DRAFT_1806949 [Mycena metata]